MARAGPGFGKTTLLTHAIVENVLDPEGTDVWIHLVEQDRRRDHLLAGLAASLAGAGIGTDARSDAPTLDEVVETVWAVAPRQVAIVLDDVHVLDGSPALDLLAELCELLPANAHLVLGSRTLPALPIRLLQARGQAFVIDEHDLAFTAGERAAFVRIRQVDLDDDALPSWPALAVLMSNVGRVASIEFLWEAVLGSLDPDRRRALGLLVEFGRVDDDLVAVVAGPPWTVATLLDGLPLIESSDGDHHRFHDLWRSALADSVTSDERRAALATGAERLIERGELVRAARCLQAAGADERLGRLAV